MTQIICLCNIDTRVRKPFVLTLKGSSFFILFMFKARLVYNRVKFEKWVSHGAFLSYSSWRGDITITLVHTLPQWNDTAHGCLNVSFSVPARLFPGKILGPSRPRCALQLPQRIAPLFLSTQKCFGAISQHCTFSFLVRCDLQAQQSFISYSYEIEYQMTCYT